jgi:hypothetical protein
VSTGCIVCFFSNAHEKNQEKKVVSFNEIQIRDDGGREDAEDRRTKMKGKK